MSKHNLVYDGLPIHSVPEGVGLRVDAASLAVGGLVARPCSLAVADTDGLPMIELRAPFDCEEGWSVSNLSWAGPRLADALALAEPLSGAAWAQVISGDYAIRST